MQINLR